MTTQEILELAPTVDPQDLITLWNLKVDSKKLWTLHGTNDISQIRGADGTPVYSDFFMRLVNEWAESQSIFYRLTLLAHTMQLSEARKLALPGMHEGKPSDAVINAFAVVPMKVFAPDVEHESLPFDMEELIQLIEKEKGPCG